MMYLVHRLASLNSIHTYGSTVKCHRDKFWDCFRSLCHCTSSLKYLHKDGYAVTGKHNALRPPYRQSFTDQISLYIRLWGWCVVLCASRSSLQVFQRFHIYELTHIQEPELWMLLLGASVVASWAPSILRVKKKCPANCTLNKNSRETWKKRTLQ